MVSTFNNEVYKKVHFFNDIIITFQNMILKKKILSKVMHIIKKSFNQQCTGHPTNSNEITISVILKFIRCNSTILFTSKFAFKRVLNTYTMNIDLLKVE